MRFLSIILVLGIAATLHAQHAENVITMDGFRWQELFGGADKTLIGKKAGGVGNPVGLLSQ